MKTWADQLYTFYTTLPPLPHLPHEVQWLFPQQSEAVLQVLQRFLKTFFNDTHQRQLLLGINPGRLGAGITGVNFTAARQLTEACAIAHPFKMSSELSAEFIYAVIHAFGGPKAFYQQYFIGSVCPLGFIKNGKNINYYDDKDLQKTVEPFIINTIEKQLQLPVDRQRCLCIGGEKNFKYLITLNARFGWFAEVVPLPHPRFIMQYRRKEVPAFIQQYLHALQPPTQK